MSHNSPVTIRLGSGTGIDHEDAVWVRACAKLIEEEGPEQFLVNLLYVLRECFQEE
jgi:hypothetical protein